MTDSIRWGRFYVGSLGLVLAAWPRSSGKGPREKAWNARERVIDTVDKVQERVWPDSQLGVVHEYSGTATLDVDAIDPTRALLAAEGIDLDQLLAIGLQIVSPKPNSAKLIYRTPTDVTLSRKPFPIPNEKRVAFEFRGGLVQDVLPPSIHPLGAAYRWHPRAPRTRDDIPMMPDALLEIWQRAMYAAEMANLSHGTNQHQTQVDAATSASKPISVREAAAAVGVSVIDAFNRAHSADRILESHGYQRRGKRWIAPTSTTGLAGVVTVERGVYSHHGSDPLGTGHAHDAFSVYAHLDHGGDVRAAVKAAAELLGMDRISRQARRAEHLVAEYTR